MSATYPLVRPRESREPARSPIDARSYAALAAAISVALGTIMLVGWWLGASFAEVGAGSDGMLPTTAASLALGGGSLWLATRPAPEPFAELAARALGVIVLALALASFAAYPLGLDVAIARNSMVPRGALLPAPNESAALALLGAALVLRGGHTPAVRRATEMLAVGAMLIGLLALFGHIYGAVALYGPTHSLRTVGMTPLAVLGLAVLATGVFSLPGADGLAAMIGSRSVGGRVARRMLAALGLIPVLVALVMLGRRLDLYTAPDAAALGAVLTVFLGLGWVLATGRALDRSDAERVRAEDEAATWRLFFECADWGAVIASPEGRIELVNPAFGELHGFTPDELIGTDLQELVPEDQRAVVVGALTAERTRIRAEHLRRDGTRFPVLIETTQIEARGAPHRAVLVQDLTDLVRAERTRARLASVVESSADAIYATTPEGIVVDWNPAAERLYGYSADEMVGRSVRILSTPEREHEIDETIDRLSSGARLASFETLGVRKDGSLVDIAITVSAMANGHGRLAGFSAIARDVTARTAMEQALRRSEQRFRELFEHASDAIFVADVDLRVTDVNQAASELIGYPRDEIIGKTLAELVVPEDVARIAGEQAIASAGRAHLGEWSLRRRDGASVLVEISAKLLADGRWLGFVRDVRARKRYEAELRQARDTERALRAELELVMRAGGAVAEELAAISETGLPSLLHTIALQAQMLTGADAAAVAMGTDPERPFDAWAFAGSDPELERAIDSFARSRVTCIECKHDVVRADQISDLGALHAMIAVPIRYGGRYAGSLFLASTDQRAPFGDAEQRVVEMLAARVAPSIETARAYASEALRRGWLSAVIDQMPEGVMILDEQGRAVLQNAAALRFASTADPDRWREAYDVRAPSGEPVPNEEMPLSRAFDRGEKTVGEELLLVRGGDMVPVVASATPVRVGERIAGAVAVFQDIEELKQLERLREEWASVVAHDLRQPLNVISMSTGVLKKSAGESLGEVERKMLDRVMSATRALTRMIDDLLDASRIEARRLTLDRADHDVEALVRDVIERHFDLFEGRTIEVRCPEPLRACIDAGRIEQVLVNLLTNAEKYGAPGTLIGISIEARPEEIEIAITNHGPGIPTAELPMLFQRFARTRDARHGKAAGIGLGLYISRGIVEAHGGRIVAESVPGETTTFRFTLPRSA